MKGELVKEVNAKAKKEEDHVRLADIVVTYFFKNKTLKEIDAFNKAEKQHGELQKIVVEKFITINVYYYGKIDKFRLRSYQTSTICKKQLLKG